MSEIGTLLPIALRTELVVVSTPFLNFRPCVVETHEPMSVQAFGVELAVQALDVAVVDGLARTREVEHYALVAVS